MLSSSSLAQILPLCLQIGAYTVRLPSSVLGVGQQLTISDTSILVP
jgi:hypothetical protein